MTRTLGRCRAASCNDPSKLQHLDSVNAEPRQCPEELPRRGTLRGRLGMIRIGWLTSGSVHHIIRSEMWIWISTALRTPEEGYINTSNEYFSRGLYLKSSRVWFLCNPMAVVLPSPASILVRSSRSSTLAVPQFLPLSSSAASSSSASSSSDFNRSSRRIRFAPLPEPRYEYETHIDECVGDTDADTHHDASDSDQSDDLALATKHTIIDVHDVHPPPAPAPTKPLPVPQSSSAHAPSRASKFWHSLPFFRRSPSSPHASPSHLPSASHSRAVSAPPLTTTSGSTVPSHKQLHISTDVHGPRNSPRGRSPPPSAASPAASTSSAFHRTISRTSVQSCPDVAKDKHERRASSILSPGAGGGRHTFSTKMVSGLSRPSTAPSPLSRPSTAPSNGTRNAGRKHVKLLNGRVYGAKGSQGMFPHSPCLYILANPSSS